MLKPTSAIHVFPTTQSYPLFQYHHLLNIYATLINPYCFIHAAVDDLDMMGWLIGDLAFFYVLTVATLTWVRGLGTRLYMWNWQQIPLNVKLVIISLRSLTVAMKHIYYI